jgi:predicted esterase
MDPAWERKAMNSTSQNSGTGLSRQAKEARAEMERALSFHFQGNKADALKALRKALKLDPSLVEEKLASNLAVELTGLPASEALTTLADGNSSQTMIHTAQREWKQAPVVRRQRSLFVVFILLFLVLIGLFAWSIYDGTLQRALGQPSASAEKSTLDGYEYYVSVPRGRAPADGWPVVMAFHGYGGNAEQILSLAAPFNDAGAIMIAPTFGTYEPNPGNGPIAMASRILTEVGKQYPLQSRGAILFGFSQGGTFAYRFSVHYSLQVAGVVSMGAPELDGILPSRNIPYVFMWGELDELQYYVMPSAQMIQSRGFNVRTGIIPGLGHAISQASIDPVLALLKQP